MADAYRGTEPAAVQITAAAGGRSGGRTHDRTERAHMSIQVSAHQAPPTPCPSGWRARRRLLLVGPLAILALLCVAAPAHAYAYWTQRSGNGAPIGRANLNGTGAKERFITRAGSTGIAVDGAHIYFTGNYTNPGTIGR